MRPEIIIRAKGTNKFMIDKNKRKENMKKYRTTWGILNPVTKIVPDKTKYSRKNKHKRKGVEEITKSSGQNKVDL